MAGPRTATFGRHGIRQRVVLVVLLGTTALVVALAWAGTIAFGRLREQIRTDRALVARSAALHIGRLLDEELQGLATLALDPDVLQNSDQAYPRLRNAFRQSRVLDSVFVVRFDGTPALVEPPSARPIDTELIDAARRVMTSGRPAITRSRAPGTFAFLLVPMRGPDAQPLGVVGGTMPPGQATLQRVLTAAAPSPHGWSELRDKTGDTAARGGTPAADVPGRAALVTAEAPVGELGWTVVVSQLDADAFAAMGGLRRAAVLATPALFAVALFLAWGAALSVVRPLLQLTKAAEAIAAGDLDRPVPSAGFDEAGRLGHALDEMRQALKQRERDRIRGVLLKKTIAAQEDERKRIARELHDETSQTINALLMDLDAGLARYPSDFTRARMDDARTLAARLLEGVHRLILALRPSVLDDLGLSSAIEWFARQQLEPLGVSVNVEVSGSDPRLPRETELALFRVAQEAITNIARHAGAEHVLVQYSTDDGRALIEIEDDGEGFNVDTAIVEADSMRGLGLAGMRERVSLAGGRIEIESTPGAGTRVLIEVPLAGEERAHA